MDTGLHFLTALAAGTVSIDVVILTVALMASFTKLSLALKFSGWMAFWHAVFTLLSTGLAVLLLKGSAWFGDGSDSSELVLRIANFLIYGGAAWLIWTFFQNTIRKNAQEAELEMDGNVLESGWRTKAFQATILSACFDALYLAKPAMYADYDIWSSFQSILLLGAEVGLVALLGGVVCYCLNKVVTRSEEGKYKVMMLGIRLEYLAFLFFFVWNLQRSAEALGLPELPLKLTASMAVFVALVYWDKDRYMVARATMIKARL